MKTMHLKGTTGPMFRAVMAFMAAERSVPPLFQVISQPNGLMVTFDDADGRLKGRLEDHLRDPDVAEGRCMAIDDEPTPAWKDRYPTSPTT